MVDIIIHDNREGQGRALAAQYGYTQEGSDKVTWDNNFAESATKLHELCIDFWSGCF